MNTKETKGNTMKDASMIDVTNMSEAGFSSFMEIVGANGNGSPVVENHADWKAFRDLMVEVYGNDAIRVLDWLPRPPAKGWDHSQPDYEGAILARQEKDEIF